MFVYLHLFSMIYTIKRLLEHKCSVEHLLGLSLSQLRHWQCSYLDTG
uniref:Uncharacterized protein n=1 Tax=Rhizophora mucronata TaxID=61149 RepID=A0A2P2PE20_RHIMU